jgi:hypothetical protein
MLEAIANLSTTVWLLSLISLCNNITSELLYPLGSLYLAAVLLAAYRLRYGVVHNAPTLAVKVPIVGREP